MPSNFPVTMVSGVPVVTAPAEIDAGNADTLRAATAHAMADGPATFVVDMTATEFCDSAGLHVLVRAHRRAQAEEGEARLVITSPAVLRVFTLTGVDRVVPIFRTLPEALAAAPATRGPAGARTPGTQTLT